MKINEKQILKLFIYLYDIIGYSGVPLKVSERSINLLNEIIDQQDDNIFSINKIDIKNE